MLIVQVLIEYASHSLDRPFSYIYVGKGDIIIGTRVVVMFHNRKSVGYVLDVKETDKSIEELESETGYKLEKIIGIIDKSPLLNDDLFELSKKVASYYLAPRISVLQAMLPPSLTPRRSTLKAPKIAFEQYFEINEEYNEEGLTNKQIELMRFVKKEKEVLRKEIDHLSVALKLVEMGRLKVVKKEKRRLAIPNFKYQTPPDLTPEQEAVVKEFNKSRHKVFLLQGVTGSGKTEVYLKLTEQALAEGKSVLMLVPEISLTPMMVEYFLRRFKNKVAILHSELTAGEKYDEYRKIARGDCKIVVGARSAIFAPLSNIGLIILDEEHVESYKQDTLPFYHAREVAIMRGEMHKAKVLLGSATPSLDSRARAQNGVYHLLKLNKRINNSELPKTSIVNMLDYGNIDRDSYIFSLKLRKALQSVLDEHHQAILLINRRGFSTHVSCRKCGHVYRCPTCGIALTYHKSDNMLKCHHCDYVEPMPNECCECGSKYIMKTGFGTERIQEEVLRLFPNARCLRLDSDSAKQRTKIPKIIEEFRNQEADILVGTQMIAKGHDFPNVTLVGIVLADIGLSMPSYRSSERAFQLITQAVGRSGRKDLPGEAIIQTYIPSHYAITMAARQDYDLFYSKEMGMRKLQKYPPYTFMAALTLSGKNEDNVVGSAFDLVDYLLKETDEETTQILGPTTPYIAKIRDTHMRTVLVKYRDQEKLREVFKKIISIFAKKPGVDITVDIDPYNF